MNDFENMTNEQLLDQARQFIEQIEELMSRAKSAIEQADKVELLAEALDKQAQVAKLQHRWPLARCAFPHQEGGTGCRARAQLHRCRGLIDRLKPVDEGRPRVP